MSRVALHRPEEAVLRLGEPVGKAAARSKRPMLRRDVRVDADDRDAKLAWRWAVERGADEGKDVVRFPRIESLYAVRKRSLLARYLVRVPDRHAPVGGEATNLCLVGGGTVRSEPDLNDRVLPVAVEVNLNVRLGS